MRAHSEGISSKGSILPCHYFSSSLAEFEPFQAEIKLPTVLSHKPWADASAGADVRHESLHAASLGAGNQLLPLLWVVGLKQIPEPVVTAKAELNQLLNHDLSGLWLRAAPYHAQLPPRASLWQRLVDHTPSFL